MAVTVAWPAALEDTALVDEFIGIVRGRSANSSRQASVRQDQQQAKKVNDQAKAKAKAKAQEAAKKAKQQAKSKARAAGSKPRKRR